MAMKKCNKSIAVLMSIFFVVAVLLSLNFTIVSSDHKCAEADCPVCAVLKVAEEMSDGAKKIASASYSFAFVFFAVLSVCVVGKRFFAVKTPVFLNDILTI